MTNDELIECVGEWFRLNYNASNWNEGEKYWRDMYDLLEAIEKIEKIGNLDTTYTDELLGRNYSI